MKAPWKAMSQTLGVFVLITLLSACGGGGSSGGSGAEPASTTASAGSPATAAQAVSDPAAVPVVPVAPALPADAGLWFASMPAPDLAPSGVFISEVANNYFSSSVSWIELYNNSGANIDLSQYRLRTPAIDLTTQEIASSITFALPAQVIPNNAYVVIAAQLHRDLLSTPNNIYIVNARNQAPYWQGESGFVELLSASGDTTDFVAFGNSTALPGNPDSWRGANVAAMASTNSSYNHSIVRPFAQFRQTHSASDWVQVNFATPGGINDVAAGVTDSDDDGIPDTAKLAGGSYGGQNLYAMGARPGQRDLFVHVDYLDSSDPGIIPNAAALNKITQAFRKQNIALHFDAGNLFSKKMDGSQHNLSGDISHKRSYYACTQLRQPSQLSTGCTSLYALKTAHMDIRRKPVFRYLLMANSQLASGNAGASGSAELLGDDFMVTQGGWGLKAGSMLLTNYQAATIMHELGHTLGLRHGGDEDATNKPNYPSVMNYFYQISGLPDLRSRGISQRYYYWLTNYQNQSANGYTPANPFPESALDDGPQSATFKIDYSDGRSAQLDESSLLEADLIGRGTAPGYFADWNGNGVQDSNRLSADINFSGSISVLRDHNDWAAVVLNTRRLVNANNSGVSMARSLRPTINRKEAFDPLTTPYQGTVDESDPPAAMLQRLRFSH